MSNGDLEQDPDDIIKWEKESEDTTDNTDDGFLHYQGLYEGRVIFEIRFLYKNGIDRWTLTYMPTGRQWTRDGISAHFSCQAIARRFFVDFTK